VSSNGRFRTLSPQNRHEQAHPLAFLLLYQHRVRDACLGSIRPHHHPGVAAVVFRNVVRWSRLVSVKRILILVGRSFGRQIFFFCAFNGRPLGDAVAIARMKR